MKKKGQYVVNFFNIFLSIPRKTLDTNFGDYIKKYSQVLSSFYSPAMMKYVFNDVTTSIFLQFNVVKWFVKSLKICSIRQILKICSIIFDK